MRTKMIAVGLVALMGLGTVGCKTASKMAWWKTADNAAADTAVLAHTAPTLPSEVARQADALAATEVNITTDGVPGKNVAAPFVPGMPAIPRANPPVAGAHVAATSVPTYPNTGASSLVPSLTGASPAQTASVPAASQGDTLGSVAMPYNPQAVPASPAASQSVAIAQNPSLDRYANNSSSVPTAALSSSTTPSAGLTPPAIGYPSTGSTSDRYGTTPAISQQPVGSQPAGALEQVAEAPPATLTTPTPPVNSGVDRYGSVATTQPGSIPPALANNMPITPTPEVATAPFRPGGTSDYPGQVAVASRPSPATSSNTGNSGPVGYAPTEQPSPRYR